MIKWPWICEHAGINMWQNISQVGRKSRFSLFHANYKNRHLSTNFFGVYISITWREQLNKLNWYRKRKILIKAFLYIQVVIACRLSFLITVVFLSVRKEISPPSLNCQCEDSHQVMKKWQDTLLRLQAWGSLYNFEIQGRTWCYWKMQERSRLCVCRYHLSRKMGYFYFE